MYSTVREKNNSDNEQFVREMRDFFDTKAMETTKGDYEYHRWFAGARKRRQYRHSTESISYHLRDVNARSCLEVGCGPGTWTRVLLARYPEARFVCLDISREMILQFKKNIPSKRVRTLVNNFLDQEFKERFDFIFCSRAIEYIPNKTKVIEKVYSLVEPGGKGIIISSPPHKLLFSLKRFIGRKIDLEHTQRISVKNITHLLEKKGFSNIRTYPILFSDFPLVPNRFLFRRFYTKPWGVVARLFASGYLTKFEKKRA